MILNSELRKLNVNSNEFTKRQTISLTGLIALNEAHFEMKKKDIKNTHKEEVSSVERISSIKSVSGLGSVFENDNEEEKKEMN